MLASTESALKSALTDVKSKATSEDKARKFLFVVLQNIFGIAEPYLFVALTTSALTNDVRTAVKTINAERKAARESGNRKAPSSVLSVPSKKVFGTTYFNGNFVFRTDDAGDENFQAYIKAFQRTSSNGGLLGLHEKMTKQRTDYLRTAPLPVPDVVEEEEDTLTPPDSTGSDLGLGLDMLFDEPEPSDSGLDLLDGPDGLDGLEDLDLGGDIPDPPPMDMDLGGLDGIEEEEDLTETVPSTFREAWAVVANATRDMVVDVDNGLEKLRVALLDSDDTELEKIAEDFFGTGFPVLHGGHKVSFTSCLLDVERATNVDTYKEALEALDAKADDYLDHIESSARVEVCDDNPAHKVGMKAGLSKVLTALRSEAQRQAKLL